jgi:ABC-2 type transport system permease protein
VLSVPVYSTNCLIGMLMMPVMLIGAMLSTAETGLGELSQLAAMIPRGAFLAGATGVFALTGAMCEASSTAVSREGRTHELRKTYPVSGALQLQAKVYMGVLFHGAGVALIAAVLCFLLPDFWLEILAGALCSVAMAFLFSLAGVIIDAHHPKLNWKTETEAVKQNFNGMIAMLLSMVLVALLVGAYILLIKWKLGWYGAFAAVMALCLLLDALLMMWLNRRSGKAYLAH